MVNRRAESSRHESVLGARARDGVKVDYLYATLLGQEKRSRLRDVGSVVRAIDHRVLAQHLDSYPTA